MTKLNNTKEFSVFLFKQVSFYEDYAPSLAKGLLAIAKAFDEMEIMDIKDLKSIPKVLDKANQKVNKAIEQQEKLKQQKEEMKIKYEKEKNDSKERIALENKKAKEQEKKLKQQLAEAKEKYNKNIKGQKDKLDEAKQKLKEISNQHKEEIKILKEKHREELQFAKSSQKTKKSKKEKIPVVSEEDLLRFIDNLDQFQMTANNIAESFADEGENAIFKLKQVADEFIKKEKLPEFKTAAKLSYVMEHGGLQAIENSSIWLSHKLSYYSVSEKVTAILSEQKLSLAQLKTIFELLQIGLPTSKSKKNLENALVKEIATRANTR